MILPTPTPAPNWGGPVACIGGPISTITHAVCKQMLPKILIVFPTCITANATPAERIYKFSAGRVYWISDATSLKATNAYYWRTDRIFPGNTKLTGEYNAIHTMFGNLLGYFYGNMFK